MNGKILSVVVHPVEELYNSACKKEIEEMIQILTARTIIIDYNTEIRQTVKEIYGSYSTYINGDEHIYSLSNKIRRRYDYPYLIADPSQIRGIDSFSEIVLMGGECNIFLNEESGCHRGAFLDITSWFRYESRRSSIDVTIPFSCVYDRYARPADFTRHRQNFYRQYFPICPFTTMEKADSITFSLSHPLDSHPATLSDLLPEL